MTRTPRKPRTKKTKAPETQALEQIQEQAPEVPETTTTPVTAERPPEALETKETTETATETIPETPPETLVVISASVPETKTDKQSIYKFCMCGCGGQTKARFAPGHDSKLHSALLREYRAGTITPERVEMADRLGWGLTPGPAPKRTADPAKYADLRRQVARAIDVIRDRAHRTREERLEACHVIDKLLKAPLTSLNDLGVVTDQLDGEAD
jgi:hypothetical protein